MELKKLWERLNREDISVARCTVGRLMCDMAFTVPFAGRSPRQQSRMRRRSGPQIRRTETQGRYTPRIIQEPTKYAYKHYQMD